MSQTVRNYHISLVFKIIKITASNDMVKLGERKNMFHYSERERERERER